MILDTSLPVAQVHFAGLIGLPQSAVAGLVAAGILREGGSGAEWMGAYCRHLRDLAHGRGGATANARQRLLAAQAERVELENRTRSGELVEVREVNALGGHWARILCRELETLAPRLAPRLLGAESVAAIAHALDEEQRSMRTRSVEEMRRVIARRGTVDALATAELDTPSAPHGDPAAADCDQ